LKRASARIVLLFHEGMTVEMIAEHLHTRPARISKWRQRFVEGRLSALSDAPRPGRPHTYTEETERRVLRLLDQAPPDGYAQWNGPLLAEALGDVSTGGKRSKVLGQIPEVSKGQAESHARSWFAQ